MAATKSFTTQLTGLYLFALYLAGVRGTLKPDQIQALIEDLAQDSARKIESIFGKLEYLEELSKNFFRSGNPLTWAVGFITLWLSEGR